MQLFIKKYKIVSNEHQYILKKQKGKYQYETISYHDSIADAINSLFEYRVRVELKDFVIDFNSAMTLCADKTSFLQQIQTIKNELLEGLNNE